MKRRLATFAALAFVLSISAAQAAEPTVIAGLFASTANDAMAEVIPLYERSHPNARIQATYAGGQVLAAQVESGANVDLILVGASTIMPLRGKGKVGAPVGIMAYREAVLVPKGSTKVRGLRDLANPGIRVALGTADSPHGKYAHTVLEKAGAKFGPDFERKVMANVVTTKTGASQIPPAVKSGVADAAIGFTSDESDAIVAIPVPAEDDVFTTLLAAVVAGTPHAAPAQDFIDYLRGPEAQAIFHKHHFDAPR